MNMSLRLLPLLLATLVAPAAHAQDAKAGDAAAGAKKVAMCIGCHGIPGYQASFPQIYKVPMISGQGAGYIASALNQYKKGDRKHPTMRGIAESLSDQDIADVAAYYAASGGPLAELPAKAPEATGKAGDLIKAGACFSCHGENYAKPLDPSYPKLAGQHADYLYAALRSYLVEGNSTVGRAHPTMGATMKATQKAANARDFDQQLKAAAQYLSDLPSDLKTVAQPKFK